MLAVENVELPAVPGACQGGAAEAARPKRTALMWADAIQRLP